MRKTLVAAAAAIASLAGCVAVPYEPGAAYPSQYPSYGYYYAPVAPAVVAPSVSLGYTYNSRGYYGHRYRGWR